MPLESAELHEELEKFAKGALQDALADLHQRIVSDLSKQGVTSDAPPAKPFFEPRDDTGASVWSTVTKPIKVEVKRLRHGFQRFSPDVHEGLQDSTEVSSSGPDKDAFLLKGVPKSQIARGKFPLGPDNTGLRSETLVALPALRETTANTTPKDAYASPGKRGQAQLASALLAENIDDVQMEQEASNLSNLLDPTEQLPEREDQNEIERTVGQAVRWAQVFVETPLFNYCSCLFVLLNSIAIGLETDYLIRHLDPAAPPIFKVVDVMFCTVFTIELTLRFMAYGLSFFTMKGWPWNVFDCIVVFLQLFDLLLHFFVSSISHNSTNLSFLRLLRILRLVRIIRLMRVLRLVDELRTMAASIMASMKSLIWTLALLFLLMYSGAVCITQVVADHLLQLELGGDVRHTQTADLKYYYGNLSRAILSLFEGITGGIDWDPLMMSLAEDVSIFVIPVFCTYVAFCLFAVMNSVTGVFVEKASAKVREDQEQFLASTCRKTFEANIFANNVSRKDQVITWKEFSGQLHSEEVKEFFKAIDVCISEAEALFRLLDSEGTGKIHFSAFMHGILKLRGPAKSLDLTLLMNETDQMFSLLLEHIDVVESKLDRIESSVAAGPTQ